MERTLSPEEKIKRAEEIYNRRRSQYYRNNVATVSVSENKNYGLLKKMILQILICLVIYFIFYLIQSSNYIFSEDVINKTKEILSYDINLPSMYSKAMEYIDTNWKMNSTLEEQNNVNLQNIEEDTNNNSISVNEINAIGGGDFEDVVMSETVTASAYETQDSVELTDEEYIKNNFSFIKPINRNSIIRIWSKRCR